MANGVSVLLPLNYSKEDGPYQLNKTIPDTVKQNLKNLILTVKGERIMDPLFGVGVYSLLFENYSQDVGIFFRTECIDQCKKYLPFIKIEEASLIESNSNLNQFYIYIKYSIQSLNVLDELTFVVTK